MGYKKGPVGHMKASAGNKAVGYMAEGSVAYMSALYAHGDPDTPHSEKKKKTKTKKETKDAYINRMLDKLQKEKPDMNPMEMMKYACLLYTSPSPRDRQKSRMPSSA